MATRKSKISKVKRLLPTVTETTKVVTKTTEQVSSDGKKQRTSTRKGRKRFSTVLHPDLRESMQLDADNKDCTIADILDNVLRKHYKK